MQRLAFKMHLRPGKKTDYIKRHNQLWPELRILLKKAGISEYSIFFDADTNILFAFQKVNNASGSQDLGNETIVQKWWAFMADIMETNPNKSPISTPLEEVFYME